jgi:ribosome modulation factor
MLPKGCGQAIADIIEERLTKHIRDLSKHATGGNPLADELLASLRQKAASESWQASDCLPDSNDTEQTHAGYAAYNAGKPHNSLPTQNPDLARQWMLGWVCAEIVKYAPPEQHVDTAAQVDQSPQNDPSELTGDEAAAAADEMAPLPKKPRKPRSKSAAKSK